MLKIRTRRLAGRGEHALRRLANIESSIVALTDDDLLDLADIYKKEPLTPLGEMASAEMGRRNIRL